MNTPYVFYSKLATDSGCVTGTRQCGPCPYNESCLESTQSSVQEPSASDWADPDCARNLEQRYD